MNVEGKTAIVSGGGAGIGRAISFELARRGAHVTIFDIDEYHAEETAGELAARGLSANAVLCDVSDPDQVRQALLKLINTRKELHIVINNVGRSTPRPRFPDCRAERWEHTLRVTLFSTITVSRMAVPFMRPRGGAIVNIAGVAGLVPFPQDPVYAAAKHGVVGYTRSLAQLEDENIRVSCLCPWIVSTEMVLRSGGVIPADARAAFDAIAVTLNPLSPESVAVEVARLIEEDVPGGGIFVMTPGRKARPVRPPKLQW